MYRVLSIDDDPTILRAYKEIHRRDEDSPINQLLELDESGVPVEQSLKERINFEIEISNSGEEGLNLVRKAVEEGNPYAVIYLDMRMPGRWNGMETAREIRSIDQDVRILVVTAYTEDIGTLYEVIGDTFVYLKKPFVEEELIQLTRFLAQDWRRTREQRLSASKTIELNEAKNQFLSIISHELRTPLTTLLGNSELLSGLLQSQQQRDLLEDIVNSGKALQGLYDELFDAAQIQARLIELDTVPFDLERVLDYLRKHFAVRAEVTGLEFTVESQLQLDHFLIGDGKRLQQVLSNLLTNAVKFTPTGFVRLTVSELSSGKLQFVVEDSGCGIDPEMVETLNHPFSQIDMHLNRKYSGFGLGLYISSGLASQMDGTLELESQLGEGTRAVLTVPFRQGEPLPKQAAPYSVEERSGRILVMDDAQEIQVLLTRQLEAYGVTVTTASNGVEGVEKALNEGPFDLLLIDLRMPKMDGLEATRELRVQGVQTPIIMLGAELNENYRAEAKAAGAYSMLPKPLTEAVLRQLVTLFSIIKD